MTFTNKKKTANPLRNAGIVCVRVSGLRKR